VTTRDRRALIVGGVLIALSIFTLRVSPWVSRTLAEQRVQLETRAELLERMRGDVRLAARLEDSGKVVKARLAELAPRLLAARTSLDAAADLSARLTAATERHAVRVLRKDLTAGTAERGGLAQAAFRLELESDTRGLLGLLDELNRASAVLTVDSLEVTVADPFASADRPELLRSRLSVRGWFLAKKSLP
jgi:hypothetical protein